MKIIRGLLQLAIVVGVAIGGPVGGMIVAASTLASFGMAIFFGPKAPKAPVTEQQIKNPVPPRVYGYGTRRLHGALAFWGNGRTMIDEGWFGNKLSDGATVDVIAFHDGRVHAVRQAYLNDDKVTVTGGYVQPIDKKYRNNKIMAGWNLGQTPAPVHAPVIDALPTVWTTNHRGDGVMTGYLIKTPESSKQFLETFPQGDNTTLSLVIDLQLCFDPREVSHDPDDESTWEWTENPVLHLLHYFIVRRGYSYGNSILPQIDKWIHAANVCDEVVSGEPRYRACVVYDSTAKPAEVIASILETFDGWYSINEKNEIIIYAGEYYEPTASIGPDDIVEYEHQYFVEEENIVNEFQVKYISSEHDYNEVEAQPWRDEDSISELGMVNSGSIDPQIPSYKQARRLAKINMSRNNTPDRGTFVTNYAGRDAENERFINLLIEEAGAVIFDGVAEIVKITRNLETHGLTIDWVRAEPNAWEWNPATEDGYGAPTGVFPTVAQPDPPTITSIDYLFDGSGQSASLTINGTGPDRSDLTWFARIRETSTSAWQEQQYNDIAPGSSVQLKVAIAPVDTSIEVQISYSIGTGTSSGWSDSAFVNADTSATPPDDAVDAPVLVSWNSILSVQSTKIARAVNYKWYIYESDGTTLIANRTSPTPVLNYTASQALSDGAARIYVFKVAGINAAGEGGLSPASAVLSNPAPDAVTGVTGTDGDYIGTVSFTASAATDLTGYALYYSKTTGFDPETEGFAEIRGTATTQQIYNLGAGTYYVRVAALDGWSEDPALLNLSTETDFTINIGTESGIGGTESGGGGGGRAGGGLVTENA